MFEQSIGDTKIAFSVFKVNRIYFMWHCRRAYFTSFDLLRKIIHGNVLPHVACKIDQYRVDPFEIVALCSKMIVMFDLRSGCATRESYPGNKIVGKFGPCNLWIRNMMGVEIT